MDKIKLLSLFSGIGAFEKALKNLNVNYELLAYSEIDKYASKAYSLIHQECESKNLGDITLIDEKTIPLPLDLITYGFPCQDISIVGGKQGLFNEDGSKTRSGLFFDALRIITHTQPKIAIAENVKNLTSKKFEKQFNIVLTSLKESGYNNYFKVLNARDYGVPQNRERVFIVSIRKDIDNGIFQFPEATELKLKLKDFVDFDNKFIVPDHILNSFNSKSGDFGKRFKTQNGDNYSMCIITKPNWAAITNNYYTDDLGTYTISEVVNNKITVYANSPRMNFNLMGFTDKDVDLLLEAGISNNQLYKLAGNSIVVNVAEEVLCQLLDDKNEIYV